MSMLVHRREDQVYHAYYSSETGLVDWISRNYPCKNEIQVASAYQNYGLLIMFTSEGSVRILPSQRKERYRESKEFLPGRRVRHTVSGSYDIHCASGTRLSMDEIFLESIRRIRVFQEAGRETYLEGLQDHETVSIVSYELSSEGISWVIERNVNDLFAYRVEMFIGGAAVPESETTFSIAAGTYAVALSLQLVGKFLDEDYAPLTSDPTELLTLQAQLKLAHLKPFHRDLATTQLEGLSLLARKGKLLAGGPRFFTYFGRDTLISIALLTGSVTSDIGLHAFRSVLERLSVRGEVAHEEVLGEYAACFLGQRIPHTVPTRTAMNDSYGSDGLLDYHMVDDDFLFPAVMAHWNEVEGTQDTKRLLSGRFQSSTGDIRSGYELLGRTITYCYSRIKEGIIPYHTAVEVGDWRDSLSNQGIRYSYEVNVGLGLNFVSVARNLAEQLRELKPFLPDQMFNGDGDTSTAAFKKETERFIVHMEPGEIRERVRRWLEYTGFSKDELSSLNHRLDRIHIPLEGYSFTAFGLDREKQPIEVQHNDVAFTLLFGQPCLEELDTILRPLETPFPLGLKTDVGILVSNPVFASDPQVSRELNRSHYHGLVVWPLMNSILFHGIQNQLERLDTMYASSHLEHIIDYRNRLERIKAYLIALHEKVSEFNSSELWTFSPTESGDIPLAFGKETGSSTESNPIQLWSCLGFTTLFQ